MTAGARATPDVSVVVSTFQRRPLLRRLVAALLAQRDVHHEIIVVDNGATDGTTELLAELAASEPRVRVLRVDVNRGPAGARNLGWRAARAPLVAFTDDDCEPTPDWLAALVAAARTADVVQGRTLPHPGQADRAGPWVRSQRIEAWTGRFETCNLLVRRSVLEDSGGFDERFHIAMGEDTDLGLRAVAAGARTGFAPDAVVHHEVWPRTYADYLRERRRWAEMVELVGLRPEVRDLLPYRWVFRPAHVAVLAGVPGAVGAVVVGHAWVPVVAAGGWVLVHAVVRRDGGPLPRRLLRGGQSLVATVWETVCFAAASVRYRTLLL